MGPWCCAGGVLTTCVLELEDALFVRRAFDVFDSDGNGHLEFHEFLVGLWNYCTLDHSSLLLFAFDLCDLDHTGTNLR